MNNAEENRDYPMVKKTIGAGETVYQER